MKPTVSPKAPDGPEPRLELHIVRAAARTGWVFLLICCAWLAVTAKAQEPAAAPTASLPAGSYLTPARVRLSTVTAGAEIWYTTDGSEPAQGAPSLQYGSEIRLTGTGARTVKAKAFAAGMEGSAVLARDYELIDPPAGGYAEIDKRQMTADASSTLPDWEPHKAIDSNLGNPGWHSALNTQASKTEWLRLDFGEGIERAIGKIKYQSRPDAPHGTFSKYRIYVTRELSGNSELWGAPVAEGAWIWPAQGTERIVEFPSKQGRFVIFQCTESLVGWASAAEVSAYQAGQGTIPTAGIPNPNLYGGNYLTPLLVSLTSDTPGTEIWYTLDGTTPTPASPSIRYQQGFIISGVGQKTMKAKAFAPGLNASPLRHVIYVLNAPPADAFAEIPQRQIAVDASPTFVLSKPQFANDGNPGSYWMAGASDPPSPFVWLRFDFGEGIERSIRRLKYLPRQDDSGGSFVQYRVFVTSSSSTSPTDWGQPAAEGVWEWNYGSGHPPKTIDFIPKTGRYLILQCLEAFAGYAPSVAEVWCYEAGANAAPAVPVLSPAPRELLNPGRVRASTDMREAEIWYTTDGSEPIQSAPSFRYESEIRIQGIGAHTVKAKAFVSGMSPSATRTAEYLLTELAAGSHRRMEGSQIDTDASTYHPKAEPRWAIDDEPTTAWLSRSYSGLPTEWLRLDFGAGIERSAARIRYLPRQDLAEGMIADFRVYVTSDPTPDPAAWGAPVAEGKWSWQDAKEAKTIDFLPKMGRFVILESGNPSIPQVAAAELTVFCAVEGTVPEAPMPEILLPEGQYLSPLLIPVSSPQASAEIWYTTDGSEPSQGPPSLRADGKLILHGNGPTILRSRAFIPGMAPSSIRSSTYNLTSLTTGEFGAIDRSQMEADASSENQFWAPARNAIDGQITQGNWEAASHTELSHSEWLRVDFGSGIMRNIGKFEYIAVPGAQGIVSRYRIYVTSDQSRNPRDWGRPVAEGQWQWNPGDFTKSATFPPKRGRFIVLQCLESLDGVASAREIVIYAVGEDPISAAAKPEISLPDGTYVAPAIVRLKCDTTGGEIWYTTDGTEPSNQSPSLLYSSDLRFEGLSSNLTLKARSYAPGHNTSAVETGSYTLIRPASGTIEKISSFLMAADASSFINGGEPFHAINDDPWSSWLTAHEEPGMSANKWIKLDFGEGIERKISRVTYRPGIERTGGQGAYLRYRLFVTSDSSTDIQAWGSPVAEGDWRWDSLDSERSIDFVPKTGRFVILQALRNYHGFAGAAEIKVFQSGEGRTILSPEIALPQSRYLSPARLRIKPATFGAEIWYTIDGSEPVPGAPSLKYEGEVQLSGVGLRTIKAKAFAEGMQPSVTAEKIVELFFPEPRGYAEVGKDQMDADAKTFWPIHGEPQHAINGEAGGDGWHSLPRPEGEPPSWLRVDFGPSIQRRIGKIGFLPIRGTANNSITFLRIFVTSESAADPALWGEPVSEVAWHWANTEERKEIEFAPKIGRFVVIEVTQQPDDQLDQPKVSEIWLYEAGADMNGVTSPVQFSVVSGSHLAPVYLNMTTADQEAEIWYTIDGTEPSNAPPSKRHASTIVLDRNGHYAFKAKAYRTGLLPSETQQAEYTISGAQAGKPEFSSQSGALRSPFWVSMASSTPDAEIWYSLDGSDPVQGEPSLRYESLLQFSGVGNRILKARAFGLGLDPSAIAEAVYELLPLQPGQSEEVNKGLITATSSSHAPGWEPSLSIDNILGSTWHCAVDRQNAGSEWLRLDFGEGTELNIGRAKYWPRLGAPHGTFRRYRIFVTSEPSTDQSTWGDPVAEGRWTWQDSSPKTVDFSAKKGRFVIFQCLEALEGWAAAGEVSVFEIGESEVPLQAAAPRILPTEGLYETGVQIRLSSTTSAAEIWYTTDGSAPVQGAPSLRYTSPAPLIGVGTVILSARAFAPGMAPSEVRSSTFILTEPPPDPLQEVPKKAMTADASSFAPGWEALKAIDGNTSTWHCAVDRQSSTTEWLRLDFGEGMERTIGRLKYLARPDAPHGTIARYRIFVTSADSTDSADWGTPAAEGEWFWPSARGEQTVNFEVKTGRFVILQCLQALEGWASAGEVWVYELAGPTGSVAGTPASSLPSSTYAAPARVRLSSATSGAEIWYTLDGSLPAQGAPSLQYNSELVFENAGAVTIKARAFATGLNPSGVLMREYVITLAEQGSYVQVPSLQMTADASSFAPGWEPAKAIDGERSRAWHCAGDRQTGTAEWLRLDFGSGIERSIGRVTYQPRYTYPHGTFAQYRIFVTSETSTDPAVWGTPAAEGTWDWQVFDREQVVDFIPKPGRFVILQCMLALEGWASAGEVAVYQAGDGTIPLTPPPQIMTPPGNYLSPIPVRMVSPLVEAEMWFKIDGTEPTAEAPSLKYTAPFLLEGSGTVTVKAKAFAANRTPSAVQSAVYELAEAPPGGFAEVPKAQMRTSASSSAPGWEPGFAVDGTTGTAWHCAVDRASGEGEWLRFDFGENIERSIGRITYHSRERFPHGTFTRYRIYLTNSASTDSADWGEPAAEGELNWPALPGEQNIDFAPKSGRFLILQCVESLEGWASAGEVRIFAAGEPVEP